MALLHIMQKMADRQPVRLVSYGDSISEIGRTPGWFGGASRAEMNWANQLAARLSVAFPAARFELIPFGIGGQNSYEGLGRLDWLGALAPDLVLVEFGANDCGWHEIPPASTAVALENLLDGIRARYGAEVVVLGLGGENPRDYGMAHMEETDAALRRVAASRQAPFVDLRAAILHATETGARWPDYHCGPRDCHPNDAGHTVWAEAVFAVLRQELT